MDRARGGGAARVIGPALLGLLLCQPLVRADGDAGARGARSMTLDHPLLAVPAGDPLELARAVDRYGDGPVLVALGGEAAVAVRLQAIRAAPFLAEPERALLTLIDIVGGRDPDLAPAAGRAVLAICRAMAEARTRPVDGHRPELERQLGGLRVLQDREHLRRDLRATAGAAAAMLEPLAPPPPESPPAKKE